MQDPEVIELVASLRGGKPGSGDENLLGKGSLDPKAASKVVMGNAQALQMCYERALKKNAALQFQKGLAVTLGITSKASEARMAPTRKNGRRRPQRGLQVRSER